MNHCPSQKINKEILANSRGMSIMEILIALTLIGLAGTFVVGKLFDQLNEGRVQTAQIQITKIGERLKEFRRHCGFYPTTDQGLDALINKPTTGRECRRYNPSGYIDGERVPVDPWDWEYLYTSDGRSYSITSLGADNAEGGEGWDADISSEDL